jgi:hypothetical protein
MFFWLYFSVLCLRLVVSIWKHALEPVLCCLVWFTSSIDETDVYDFNWARALISCFFGGELCTSVMIRGI